MTFLYFVLAAFWLIVSLHVARGITKSLDAFHPRSVVAGKILAYLLIIATGIALLKAGVS